ncbi:hypothetical protein K1T71_003375 [Dendrolimus kikuchii]|uniref:Uncharacterized protein n=1 Tax=Dendrolimus kikuchii TaxID=765133 RepID=A0ACC1DBR3_9NEOP|nr:hypothetical protein K1T71_003375 [Dendrolimus kikuchii]
MLKNYTMYRILIILFCVLCTTYPAYTIDYCINRSPQNSISVNCVLGLWYGVEYIRHLEGDEYISNSKNCFIMHISEQYPVSFYFHLARGKHMTHRGYWEGRPSTENLPQVPYINAKHRQDYRHLRLRWVESGETSEYALYFRNYTAGLWQVVGGQNGTLPSRKNYQQFIGTIQVLNAVNDHLVLNFCQEPTNGRQPQYYSVLLSREPELMANWEIYSIHNMLTNKNLAQTRMTSQVATPSPTRSSWNWKGGFILCGLSEWDRLSLVFS